MDKPVLIQEACLLNPFMSPDIKVQRSNAVSLKFLRSQASKMLKLRPQPFRLFLLEQKILRPLGLLS